MIKVFGFGRSRAFRVVWALEEAGLDYAFAPIDASKGEHRSPAYLAINPGGKVPAIVHGELSLTESSAIVTYVADLVPESGLAPPPRTAARARYDEALSFVVTELEQPLWTMGKHTFVLPPKLRVAGVLPTAHKEFERAAGVLALRLADRPYMLGDAFTMADVMAGHTLEWARRFKVELHHDVLVDYVTRMVGRPGWASGAAKVGVAIAARDAAKG